MSLAKKKSANKKILNIDSIKTNIEHGKYVIKRIVRPDVTIQQVILRFSYSELSVSKIKKNNS